LRFQTTRYKGGALACYCLLRNAVWGQRIEGMRVPDLLRWEPTPFFPTRGGPYQAYFVGVESVANFKKAASGIAMGPSGQANGHCSRVLGFWTTGVCRPQQVTGSYSSRVGLYRGKKKKKGTKVQFRGRTGGGAISVGGGHRPPNYAIIKRHCEGRDKTSLDGGFFLFFFVSGPLPD